MLTEFPPISLEGLNWTPMSWIIPTFVSMLKYKMWTLHNTKFKGYHVFFITFFNIWQSFKFWLLKEPSCTFEGWKSLSCQTLWIHLIFLHYGGCEGAECLIMIDKFDFLDIAVRMLLMRHQKWWSQLICGYMPWPLHILPGLTFF